MKKLFVVLISMLLCLAVSDVGSVYAKGKGSDKGPKSKAGKSAKQKKGNPPGPKDGEGKGLKNKAAVNSKWEKRADANNDGIVGPTEKQK